MKTRHLNRGHEYDRQVEAGEATSRLKENCQRITL
jgi:hypothetical protein